MPEAGGSIVEELFCEGVLPTVLGARLRADLRKGVAVAGRGTKSY